MSQNWYDDPRMTAASFDGDDSLSPDPVTAQKQLLNSIGYRMAVALGEVEPDHHWEGDIGELASRFFARVARRERSRVHLLELLERHELPGPEGRKDWSRLWPSEIRELLSDQEMPR